MNVKTKIALHTIMQKLSRGIITQDQADAEYEKMTGTPLAVVIASDDEETGKFLAFLETAYPEPQAPQSEQEQEGPEDQQSENSTDAPAVPVDQPKRTRQTKPKEGK